MDAKTQKGQTVLRYLKEHPTETNVSLIAKETGATRPTVRRYLEAFQASRSEGGKEVENQPGKTEVTNPPTGDLPAGKKGRRFEQDFPPEATKPKEPEPPKRKPDLDDLPDPDDDEDDGFLGMF